MCNLQFQALGKQVDDIKTKLVKFEDKLEQVITRSDVVIAAALLSLETAGSFFFFKTSPDCPSQQTHGNDRSAGVSPNITLWLRSGASGLWFS